jgi:hypothetical protein
MPQTMLSWRRCLRQLSLVLLSVCLVACLGCGSSTPTGTVKGTVTLNGAPYADAAVIFLSLKTGQGDSTDIQAGGTFQLPTPLQTGTYTVYLAPKAVEASEQPTPVSIDQTVPEKYWNEAASDIKIEVNEGENDVKVELKK